jgi:hypothetical protein
MRSSKRAPPGRRRLVVGASGDGPRATCRSCDEDLPQSTLDDNGWCPQCRSALEKAAARGQHAIAALITVPFAIWIAVEGTRGYFPFYAWAIPLAAAYYLGMRIGREVVRGWVRSRRGT